MGKRMGNPRRFSKTCCRLQGPNAPIGITQTSASLVVKP